MRSIGDLLRELRAKDPKAVLVWRYLAIGSGTTLESARLDADRMSKIMVTNHGGVTTAISAEEAVVLLRAGAHDLGQQAPRFSPRRSTRSRIASLSYDEDYDDPDNPYSQEDSALWEGGAADWDDDRNDDDDRNEDASTDDGLARSRDGEPLYVLFPGLDAPTSTQNIKLLSDEAERIFTGVAVQGTAEHLTPRDLEKLLAECLRREGYETYLTPSTRDGGCDVYAVMPGPLPVLVVAEAKKMRLVSPSLVCSLAAVRDLKNAHIGLLATTGRFSPRTRSVIEKKWHRLMNLRDGEEFMEWVRSLKHPRRR